MKIGNRNFLILKEIIEKKDSITGKELENKFHLTRKQLSYGLGKINSYLKSCGYPEITRAANGRIFVHQDVISGLNMDKLERENEEIIFSKEERIDILYLMLLTSQQELSLQHFISELKVSKNTVLSDLKKLSATLSESRLILSYERQSGYTLIGSEYDKRQLLTITLSNLIIQYNHSFIVRNICDILPEEIARIRTMLMDIERELDRRFAGEMLKLNSYLFTIIFRRIREGLILDSLPEDLRAIDDTVEYGVIKNHVHQWKIDNSDECMYLTAHIQGMKIESAGRVWDVVNEFRLRKAIEKVIDDYEKLADIHFAEKEELEDLLVHHCRPALYRIRYDFHIGLDITPHVLPEYEREHMLVRQVIEPLEEAVYSATSFRYDSNTETKSKVIKKKKIPEKELVYITLIIASYAMQSDLRPRAVVVCQNGITVSRILTSLLHNLFSEIQFVKCMSVEQFEHYKETYDVVFSTIPLQAECSVYIVDPLMTEKQQENLRKTVLRHLPDRYQGNVKNRERIRSTVRYSNNEMNSIQNETVYKYEVGRQLHLKDLLICSHIRVANADMEWKEAIEFAAMPLLFERKIQIHYVEAVINNIIDNRPYLAIADGVVIAHAGIDAGVNDVGMTMLVLPNEISILGYMKAKVIIILATPDYEIHLTALNELVFILEDARKLKKIQNAKTVEDIVELL